MNGGSGVSIGGGDGFLGGQQNRNPNPNPNGSKNRIHSWNFQQKKQF